MSNNRGSEKIKSKFSKLNEGIYSSKEISGIGKVGTVRLLKGAVAKFLNNIGRLFAYTSTRIYGFFLLSFGFASLFLQLAQYYFVEEAEIAFSSLIIGFSIVLLSVPFMIFDKPVAIALQDNPVTDYLLFEFLLIKRQRRDMDYKSIPLLVSVFLGIVLATLGFVFPLHYIVIFAFILIVGIVALVTPEFSMITALLVLPYVNFFPYSDIIWIALSSVVFVSFAIKVAVGKRVYNFNIYDALTFLMIIFILIGGGLGRSSHSFRDAIVISALLLACVAASNLIVNRRIADCAVKAIIFSSVPIAALAIVEYILEFPKGTHPLSDGISVFFGEPMSLSAFILVSTLLSLTLFFEKKQTYKKLFYFFVFSLELAILIMLMQPSVWLSLVIAVIAGLILTSRSIPHDLVFVIVILPILILLIPSKILDNVSDVFNILPSFSDKIAGYAEALGIFKENLGFGVGRADDVILNTFLGIGIEFGIVVLIIFAVMLILRFRHLSYYRHYVRNSLVYTSTNMTAISTAALLALGFDAYIFKDLSILFLFFMIFGICAATVRTAKREYNDRFEYYGDSSSSESSAVDIGIHKNF